MDLVYCTGTRRCRAPGRTLELIGPLLGRFGITRLADITGLDFLGVPVAQAVRPAAATVTVSQGKGATRAAAMVSAAMEAIELSRAEDAVPACSPDLSRRGPRAGLPARGPGHGAGQPGHGPTVLDWIPARGALSGARFMVPRDLGLDGPADLRRLADRHDQRDLQRLGRLATAARRRSRTPATSCRAGRGRGAGCHPGAARRFLDLDTVPDGWCAELIARIQAAGGWLAVAAAGPGRSGLGWFAARGADRIAAMLAAGAGAHADPAIALSRAITEAAQSRLTVIAGARDDISGRLYPPAGTPAGRPARAGRRKAGPGLAAGLGWSCRTDDEEAARVAAR